MTKEEAKKFGLQLLHGIMERNESYPIYANNVKQAIEALSEPNGSSEIPKDLEEAADDYIGKVADDGWEWETHDIVEAFIAGAKWQAEQDQETIELAEDHAYLAGAVNEREKMMNESVEVEVTETCGIASVWFKTKQFKPGQKVKLIIVKED